MSALLDAVLDAERLAEISRNDAARDDHGPMRGFRVQIKRGAHVARDFQAMGRHALTVAQQHECLCEPGQYVWVQPLARETPA